MPLPTLLYSYGAGLKRSPSTPEPSFSPFPPSWPCTVRRRMGEQEKNKPSARRLRRSGFDSLRGGLTTSSPVWTKALLPGHDPDAGTSSSFFSFFFFFFCFSSPRALSRQTMFATREGKAPLGWLAPLDEEETQKEERNKWIDRLRAHAVITHPGP